MPQDVQQPVATWKPRELDWQGAEVLSRACDVSEAIAALPAVPTLDWCDRAAEALARSMCRGMVVVMAVRLDPSGAIASHDAVGAALRDSHAQRARLASDLAPNHLLDMLRSRAYGLRSEIVPGAGVPTSASALPASAVSPHWRDTPLGRLWSDLAEDDIVIAWAPMEPTGHAALVAMAAPIESPSDAIDATAVVIRTTIPRLARRAAESIGVVAGTPRQWVSPREQEVLDRLILGRSIKEIAEDLSRSPHTVHDHVKSLHRKLNASTRGELIARALGLAARGLHADQLFPEVKQTPFNLPPARDASPPPLAPPARRPS